MERHLEAAGRRAGFTLLELTISAAILAGIMGSLTLLGLSSSRLYKTRTLSADLETRAHRTVRRLARELMVSGVDVLLPDPQPFGTETLTFQKGVAFAEAAIGWGPQARFEFVYDPDEVDDGKDNNGNGLIDEGRIVWTRNVGAPDERSVVLCHQVREYLEGEVPNGLDDNGNGLVDEKGLSFERNGENLIIRLTLERLDSERRLITRTQETSVKLRN